MLSSHLREMPHFQLYFMNPVSGHIERRETIHAGDDVAAVHRLQGLGHDAPVELWRDGRKLAREDGPTNLFRDRVLSPVPTAEPQAD